MSSVRIKMGLPPGTVLRYIRERDFWPEDDLRLEDKNLGRRPEGMFLAVKTDTAYKLGYSLCNPSDRFNRGKALNLAYKRCACSRPIKFDSVNPRIQDILVTFTDRCRLYYKHGPFTEPENWLAGQIPTNLPKG
jgi:hypothetical protein